MEFANIQMLASVDGILKELCWTLSRHLPLHNPVAMDVTTSFSAYFHCKGTTVRGEVLLGTNQIQLGWHTVLD